MELLDQVSDVAHQLTFQGYQNLVAHFLPQITLVMVLYIATVGWLVLQGHYPFSIPEASKQAIKLSCIFMLATQWGVFSEYVYDFLTQGPAELVQVLFQHLSVSHLGHPESLGRSLEWIFQRGIDLGSQVWALGGLTSVCLKLYAGLIWLVTVAVASVALLELVSARFCLSILLLLAPIFLLLALWRSSWTFFEGWLKQSVAFALTPIFIFSVLLLMITPVERIMSDLRHHLIQHTLTLQNLIGYFLGELVTIGLLLKARKLAFEVALSGSSLSGLSVLFSRLESRWLASHETKPMIHS